jgi:hypothetical protein
MVERRARRGATIAFLFGAAALALLLASFGARLWWFGRPAPIPALLQDLGPSRGNESQKAFIARLQQRFPAGSMESALIAELRAEGFTLRSEAPEQGREAAFDRGASFADPCRRGAAVRWRAEGGRISEISGGYYTYCP